MTLRLLVLKNGEVVSREEFLNSVWAGEFVEEGNLTQTVFLLRRALGKLDDGGEYIETVPRIGYRLAPRALAANSNPARTSDSDYVVKATEFVRDQSGHANLRAKRLFSSTPKPIHFGLILLIGAACCAAIWASVRKYTHPVVLRSIEVTSDGLRKPAEAPLLLDGSRLLLTESIGNQSYLGEVSALGGGVSRLASPIVGGAAVTKSQHETDVVFASHWEDASDPQLTALSLSDRSIHHIGAIRGHDAAWSPDGSQLAVASGRKLFVYRPADGNIVTLASLPDVPFWPAWSPDGRRIRFTRQEGGLKQSLWEIGVKDGVPQPLLSGSPHEHQVCCGSWSPDGRYFIYVLNQGSKSSLWLLPESFSSRPHLVTGEIELASGPVDFWRSPVMSADGHVYAIGEEARGETVQLLPGLSGGTTTFLGGLSADMIAYSHDGKWISYISYPDGALWRAQFDGSDRLRLTQPGQLAYAPQWSPDDRSIVYVSLLPGQRGVIQEIPAEGGESRTIVDDELNPTYPTFSPDGKTLAFSVGIGFGVAPASIPCIRILNLESEKIERLPGSESLWMSRWSPDGQRLAAVTTDRHRLMLYDFRTHLWSTISSQTVNDFAWDRGGQNIYFDTRIGLDPIIFKVDVASGKVDKVAVLPGFQRTGFLGTHLALSPTGQILVLRDAGISDVYRLDVSLP